MGAVLGFLRLLVPSWLVQNRTATRRSRRRGNRRRTVTLFPIAAAAVAMIVRSVAVTVVLTGIDPLVFAGIEVWVTVRF